MSVVLLVTDLVSLTVEVLGGLSDTSFTEGLEAFFGVAQYHALAAFQMDSSFIGMLAYL